MLIAIAASRSQGSAPVRQRASRTGAFGTASDAPLDEAQIAGGFSLIDQRPLAIAAAPGLVVRVRTGSLWVTQHKDRQDHLVRAGERFVSDRAGPLVISALATTELRIEWPPLGIERLSPGLEPVDGVA